MPTSRSSLFDALLHLPGSYSGPIRAEATPYGLVGVGEGTLAAHLAESLIPNSLTHRGTQFVLSSPDARRAAADYADLAEVAGADVRRVSTGGTPQELDVLIPGGPQATYHFAQYLAHASAQPDQADQADQVLRDLAERCAPHVQDGNPARDLAWSLWGRTPLLLAAPDAAALPHAWQQLLARTGKTLGVPLLGDLLPLVTGEFEAQHEKGDAKVALILGDADDTLLLAREVLASRIDEIIHVPYPQGAQGYPALLGLWYFGAWVAAYLAERYHADPADPPMLSRAQVVLSGEESNLGSLRAPRDDLHSASDDRWPDDGTDDLNDAQQDED